MCGVRIRSRFWQVGDLPHGFKGVWLMRRAILRSLAKINLDLRVLQKRADGFHELRTVFQTISLADRIEVSWESGKSEVLLEDSLNIPNNLILLAAEALKLK